MEKMWLTNGGNLFRLHPGYAFGKYYFQKPDGEFIREVTDSYAKYLLENCLEIEVSNPPTHPDFFPTWHFIKSVKVLDDFTDWHTDRCRNGGNYSFHTYHDWYVAQYPDGSWRFAFVKRYSTSAEFEFDELNGTFQSDLGTLYISNGVNCPQYSSQKGIEWKNNEKFYTSPEMLEKIATMSSFEHLWNEIFEYIPSRWDEDEEEIQEGLSFSLKKQIVTRLKELGVEKKKKPTRGQRRNRR